MLDIIFIILANSMAQVMFALSVNRVYRMYGVEEGFHPVDIAEDMKWWEIFLYGIYKHNKVSRVFTTGLWVSAVSMIICRQFSLETMEVALLHTILLTTLYLSDKFHYLLPNTIVGVAFIIEIFIKFSTTDLNTFYLHLGTAGFIFLIFIIIFAISCFSKEPMGGGDLKVMPFVAMWLGPLVILALLAAFILSTIYCIHKRKKSVAFGPFLIMGAWITILAKPYITEYIFQLLGGFYT